MKKLITFVALFAASAIFLLTMWPVASAQAIAGIATGDDLDVAQSGLGTAAAITIVVVLIVGIIIWVAGSQAGGGAHTTGGVQGCINACAPTDDECRLNCVP